MRNVTVVEGAFHPRSCFSPALECKGRSQCLWAAQMIRMSKRVARAHRFHLGNAGGYWLVGGQVPSTASGVGLWAWWMFAELLWRPPKVSELKRAHHFT